MFDARTADDDLEGMIAAQESKWRCETPLRNFAPDDLVRILCQDCGLERSETIGRLVQVGRFGRHTLAQLEQAMACTRTGCGGALDMYVGG